MRKLFINLDELDEDTRRNIELYFPFVGREGIEYIEEINAFMYEIKLSNGRTILYDDMQHGIRTLPKDSNDMTEDQCRNEFRNRLYQIMRWKGMTQSELSDLTGISQVQISKYMMGKATPSFYNVDKIAKALGCSIEEFRYV